MRRALRYFGYMIAGLSFWIPSILVHAVRARNFGASHLDMLAILILPLVAALLVWELLHRWSGTQHGTVAAWMLLGIWIFGPLCITVSSTFSDGGFAQAQAWHLLLLGIPLFLPMTFMMSTYDGTLGALAVVTLWFIISSFIGLIRKRPPTQAPPVV